MTPVKASGPSWRSGGRSSGAANPIADERHRALDVEYTVWFPDTEFTYQLEMR
jgi:hypothetical protein